MGRPSDFNDPKELQAQIDEFFDNCDEKEEKPTITGLAYHLGFESRQSFYDYEKKPDFSYTIKRARLRIEMHYEQQLATKWSTGAIFALKNFGWTDKQDITIGAEMVVKFDANINDLISRATRKPD